MRCKDKNLLYNAQLFLKKDIIRHKYLTYIYSKASYLHQYLSFIRRLAASLLALHGKANNATFYILLEMDDLHHQPPPNFSSPSVCISTLSHEEHNLLLTCASPRQRHKYY